MPSKGTGINRPYFLEVKNVSKEYAGQPVLKGISFDVKEKEIVAILGPSGCGKSSDRLLSCWGERTMPSTCSAKYSAERAPGARIRSATIPSGRG